MLLMSLLLANNRYLRGRVPEGALEIALANKSKGSKSHKSSASGRNGQVCQQERPRGSSSVSQAPWEKPLASISISSPSNLPLCLEASIYSWPLSLKYVPSSGPGRQMCVHHTSVY